jgi:hypothetical protein
MPLGKVETRWIERPPTGPAHLDFLHVLDGVLDGRYQADRLDSYLMIWRREREEKRRKGGVKHAGHHHRTNADHDGRRKAAVPETGREKEIAPTMLEHRQGLW